MRPTRLFFLWLCAFASVYGLNLLAATAWVQLGYQNAYLVAAMVCTPLVYLLFGWLYYRPGFAQKRSERLWSALIWIALDFFTGMLLLSATAGVKPTDMFSPASLVIESANLVALLLAGYLATTHAPPERLKTQAKKPFVAADTPSKRSR